MIYFYYDDNEGKFKLDEEVIDLLAYQDLEREEQLIKKYCEDNYKH